MGRSRLRNVVILLFAGAVPFVGAAPVFSARAETPASPASQAVAPRDTPAPPDATDATDATDHIVALVNGRAITFCEVVSEAAIDTARLGGWRTGTPADLTAQAATDLRQAALASLVFKLLVIEEAGSLQLFDIPADERERALGAFLSELSGPQGFVQFLAAAGLTVADLRERLARDLRVEKFLRYRLSYRSDVSDADVNAWFQKHREGLGADTRVDTSADPIKREILKERLAEVRTRWFEKARDRADIQIVPEALDAGPRCRP
jgi:hypothetical protein